MALSKLAGNVSRAAATLDDDRGRSLRAELVDLFTRFNRGTDEITLLEGEFLSVEATC